MSKITPTVGRVVWYFPPADSFVNGSPKGQPFPALITHVWGDSCVNLAVQQDGSFPLRPECLTPTSVDLAPPDMVPVAGHWCWMPYQQGQAAKTESLTGPVKEALRKLAACEHTDVQRQIESLLSE